MNKKINNKKKIWLVTIAISASFSTTANADYLKLYAPRVEKGERSVEADWNYSTDSDPTKDKYFSQVYGAEYGVTDYWMTEIGAEIEKENGDNMQLTNLKWENVLVPFKPGENFIDMGVYLELEKAAHGDDPNHFEGKVLLEKDFGNWVNIVNVGASTEFGPNSTSGWDASLAVHTGYRFTPEFQPGFEYYADYGNTNTSTSFSDQEHLFGPAIYGKLGHIKYDTGILFGISDAAQDATAKLNLEYEF